MQISPKMKEFLRKVNNLSFGKPKIELSMDVLPLWRDIVIPRVFNVLMEAAKETDAEIVRIGFETATVLVDDVYYVIFWYPENFRIPFSGPPARFDIFFLPSRSYRNPCESLSEGHRTLNNKSTIE